MSRSALIALVTCFISLVPVLPAAATASMDQTAGDPRSRLDPDRKHLVFLNPAPVVSISGPTGGERDLLTKIGYRNWRFQEGTAPAGGSFNLLQYGAFALTTLGGANLSVLYNDGIAAPRTNYDWVPVWLPDQLGQQGQQALRRFNPDKQQELAVLRLIYNSKPADRQNAYQVFCQWRCHLARYYQLSAAEHPEPHRFRRATCCSWMNPIAPTHASKAGSPHRLHSTLSW